MSTFTAIVQGLLGFVFATGWVAFKLNEDDALLVRMLSLLFFVLMLSGLLGLLISLMLIAQNESLTYLSAVAEPFIISMVVVIGLVITLLLMKMFWLFKDLVTDYLPKLFNFRGIKEDDGKNRNI